MDKEFLNKVLNQIVSETELVYDRGRLWYIFPFSSQPWLRRNEILIELIDLNFGLGNEFDKHCRDIYGLSNDEIDYVYKEYSRNLRDKIKSNG